MRNFPLLLISLLAACGHEADPPLLATDIEVTTPMPGTSMSAAYMTLSNNSFDAIRISRISSPQYGLVEIHETAIDDDVARMRQLDELLIEPDDSLQLQRGGTHLMMMRPIANIEMVTLNLYDGELLILSLQTSRTVTGN